MSIQGSKSKDQQTQVNNELATQNNTVTDKLNIPGIKTLHTKPVDEIAAVLANLIKSRAGITKLTYNIGEDVEVTYNSNPHSQLRG